ncbi:XRE family transcriptional regulator [Amycolatopsis balhimycina DSM 5908]|uniref:XRE family transcriptional regulator n=2 Tax=Amycolatopsis balhimycina TaxID=208443 RepID=A0A428W075_AMYBA|nr:XRE family transcriptional regulator [Amycolatopsis balhimycina DSM 5908]
MDRAALGDFLRRRREALTPADLGLPPGTRRRTPELRREEVAMLTAMSANYYERLEQARGPQPSVSVLGALARTLRLTSDETGYLYTLAGHAPPPRPPAPHSATDPSLLTALGSLGPTTIGLITDDLGAVLAQNALSAEVYAPFAGRTGIDRNIIWRWFADRAWRDSIARPEEQEQTSRAYVADLRLAVGLRAGDHDSVRFVRRLRAGSASFTELWERHQAGLLKPGPKLVLHPRAKLELSCAVLPGRAQGQRLVLFRADPGSPADRILATLHPTKSPSVE